MFYNFWSKPKARNSKVQLERLETLPPCDVGAPLPSLLADDYRLTLFYLIAEKLEHWDGKSVRSIGRPTEGEQVAIVRFNFPLAHSFGPPNDEAISGHPYYGLGLLPYAAFEVHGSEWLDELKNRNRVHPYHRDELFQDLRHFILVFHDSTLEVVAESFVSEVVDCSSDDRSPQDLAIRSELDGWANS